MRLSWRHLPLALLLGVILAAGTGCSGLNASGSVNPLMFLIPGASVTPARPAAPEPTPAAEPLPLLARAS